MLWYKAWLETRMRFLISLAATTALCWFHVYHSDTGLGPRIVLPLPPAQPPWPWPKLPADSQDRRKDDKRELFFGR